MNNIISKVASSVLLAGIVVSGVSAKSLLLTDGNNTNDLSKSFAIDIAGASETANLTFIPNINAAPGSGFTLKFENGGYEEQPSIFLCARKDGNTSNIATDNMVVVGNMFSKGTVIDGVMTNPKFQFKNDANESQIQHDSHIYFRTNDQCTVLPKIIGVGGACLSVSAQIVDGVTTQSTPFPDYDTDKRVLGTTKKMIKVSCTAPICKIDATEDMKKFTYENKAAGINGEISNSTVNGLTKTDHTNDTGTIADCPDCGQITSCVTYLQIENNSTTAIQGMKFAMNFYNTKGEKANDSLKLESTIIDLDRNKTSDYTIDGSTVALTGLNIAAETRTIKVTYTPNETDVIPAGVVKARVFDLDTDTSDDTIDVTYDKVKTFATFEVAGLTKFTVPYMNTDYRTFVKITTKSADSAATLSAVITDQNGKSTEVTLDDIPANGTVYIFSDHGKLYDAAQEAGLANAWTVEFTTSAAAIVDAYMRTPNNDGDRKIGAF